MSDPWWVGWASAGVCTLGWLSLAVRTGASQRQAKLMQRGPIIAGPVEGDAAVLAAAQRFQQGGGEWLSRKAGAWDCSPARPKGGLFSVCSDAGGKHAFQGSTQILALCVCVGGDHHREEDPADAGLQLFLMAQNSKDQLGRKGKGEV